MNKKNRRPGVMLRALETGDLERTLRWHNNAGLYECLGGTLRFVSRQTEEAWLQQKAASAPGEINLAICLTPAGEHIGNLYLRDINWVARHAEIHMFIGETKLRGKGYGTAALRQIMAHAFDTLGLQRLFLYVLADNHAAIRLYETCGFVVEGRLKRHAFKSGKFKDMLVMGLCAAG